MKKDFIEFPKALYSAEGDSITVKNKDEEEDLLAQGWGTDLVVKAAAIAPIPVPGYSPKPEVPSVPKAEHEAAIKELKENYEVRLRQSQFSGSDQHVEMLASIGNLTLENDKFKAEISELKSDIDGINAAHEEIAADLEKQITDLKAKLAEHES